jgi:hypothetical protein
VSGDDLPRGMELDLDALAAADVAFSRLERPPHENPWDALAWEATTRVDLVVAARSRPPEAG